MGPYKHIKHSAVDHDRVSHGTHKGSEESFVSECK